MPGPLRDDDIDDRELLIRIGRILQRLKGEGRTRPLTASTIEGLLRDEGVTTTRVRVTSLMDIGEALGVAVRGSDTTRGGVASPRWSAGPLTWLPPGDLHALAAAARGTPREPEPTGDPHLNYMVRLTEAMERLCSLLVKDVPGPLFTRNGKAHT